MIKILRTNAENQDFIDLVKHLDADLAIRDGDDHDFYDQFNKIDHIKHIVVAYEKEKPIACGAIKEYATNVMEVKRMFTLLESRGKGIAAKILRELEKWAAEMNYEQCILETGIKQPEAIALYKKCGYEIISNYGQYTGVANSICFGKDLKK